MTRISVPIKSLLFFSCLAVPSAGNQLQFAVYQRDTVYLKDSVVIVVECMKIAPAGRQKQDTVYKKDTVYQKDGEIVVGTIIANNQGSTLKIKVGPHSTWVLYYSDIARIDGVVQDSLNREAKFEVMP